MYINGNLYYRNNYRYCKMYKGSNLEWIKFDAPNYLYFYANEDSTVEWTTDGSISPNLEYSTDGKNFTQWDYSNISIPANSTIYFRGVNNSAISNGNNRFNINTGNVKVGGSIQSLIDGIGKTLDIPANFMFHSLFKKCSVITEIDENTLPATGLKEGCYAAMLSGCGFTKLSLNLPATTLSNNCYQSMFQDCKSIKILNVNLLAKTATPYCYASMFKNNISLVTANVTIAATEVGEYSFHSMFRDCNNLTTTTIDTLYPKVIYGNTYSYMFYGCSKLQKAPKILAETYSGTLPFGYMFYNCNQINNIECWVNSPSTSAFKSWMSNVKSSGTFYKQPNATWTRGVDGIPSGWTVGLLKI